MNRLVLWLLFSASASVANGQTVLQGDSLYQGIQPGQSSEQEVVARLGRQYKARDILGTYTATLRSGGCVSGTYVASVAMHYPKKGITCYVPRNSRRRARAQAVGGIDFDSTARVQSVKGIQPGRHTFADVVARYGPVDFDKKDNSTPKVEQSSDDGENWMTSIVFPTISFRSAGKRQPGENLLLRRVEIIRLSVE